jgi:exodeoxyribonuclease V alpha subunit
MGRGGAETSGAQELRSNRAKRSDDREPFDFLITRKMFPKRGQPEKDDGFTIARGTNEQTGEEVVCKGNFGPVVDGQLIRILRWSQKEDPKWGPSIRVWAVEHSDPLTRESVEKYLEHLPGVGPVTARAIVAQLGPRCLEKIDRDPAILRDIEARGFNIPAEELDDIAARWEELRADRKALIYLSSLGLGDATARKVIDHLGPGAIEALDADPYALCQVPGVGFRIADGIAAEKGISALDPRRLGAGIEHLLQEAESEGHICLDQEAINFRGADLLRRGGQVPSGDDLNAALQGMVEAGRLWIEEGPDGKERIYTTEHYLIETRLYGHLGDRLRGYALDLPAGVTEKPGDSLLTDQQWQGVQQGFSEQLSVLTGGPGCGKTFTLKTMLDEIERNGERALCLAPTGKAAKRMNETTGREASTIHRALGFDGLKPPRDLEEGSPGQMLSADVIVVDEASMLDMRVAERLFSHIPPETRVVLVGDPGQLPAVGAGSVLHDLIESDRVPTTELTEVFRQAEGSLLVVNAHRIREGKEPYWSKAEAEADLGHPVRDDWRFIEAEDSQEVFDGALDQARQAAKELGILPSEVMVTAPSKRGSAGTHALNAALAEERNPDGLKIRDGQNPLRVGDRVMNTKNRYGQKGRDNSVMNGDQGQVISWDGARKTALVDFGLEEQIAFTGEELEALIPAYAATTHKLQGSEYPAVVCPVSTDVHPRLLSRNMFYTGMTRAKEICLMVGSKDVLRQAIAVDGSKRNTTLDLRIGQIAPRIKRRAERLAGQHLKVRSPEELLYPSRA